MVEFLGAIPAEGEGLNIVLLIGIAIFGGTVGARLFQRLHIPQILGYIVIGILLGPVVGMVSTDTIDALEPFNLLALGVIGFMIGAELKRDTFVKFGKQVFWILILEGGAAFVLVGGLSFLIMLNFVDWPVALSVGVVFGAICAATDPASTANVLWEYRTRGPLTTMLLAIVALDDALAMVLYITSISIAGVLTHSQPDVGLLMMLLHGLYEIVGSLGLGVLLGFLLREIVKRVDDDDRTMVFTLSTIVLTVGLAEWWELDKILASMALGVTLINLSPRRSLKSFDLVRKFSPPIYVLFFVMVGARFNISSLSGRIWLLAGAYVVGSIVGKTTGSYWGGVYSKAAPTVRKYLGYCLYQQGTIAIALLIMASRRFEGATSETMLSVIIIGVFVLQVIGPFCTKIGAKKAGEVGMNITEEDLIKTHTVGDVMDKDSPIITAGMSLSEVIKLVSETNNLYYSVIDEDKKLIGAVTLDGIRSTFATQELNDWLVALDISEPIIAKGTPDMPLAGAFEEARRLDIEHLPVVGAGRDDRLVGVLDCRAVRRSLSAEVLRRQRKADTMHEVGEK
ncbi:MAG: cation:proton antiporter [Phycisphaerae bacterium]|nr:cation:proton antiporter [Phycisphaerae bacterium]